MKSLKFRESIEDIYGFTNKTPEPVKANPQDELPIQTFYMSKLIENLANQSVGALQISRPFEDHVQWGTTDGAIRARLTPNRGLTLERLTSDLQGQPLWVTKKLVSVKTDEFIDHEDIVANEIVDHVRFIAREQIDSPQRGYKQLFDLTKRISQQIKNASPMFVYDEIKQISEFNYNIQMSVKGAGVGRIAATGGRPSRQTALGLIDMSYDPDRGAIKGIVTTVDIESEGSPWRVDIPYFTGNFSPSQPMDEVVRVIVAGLKFI